MALAKALEADPSLAGRIAEALKAASPDNAESEQATISAVMRGPKQGRAVVAPTCERIAEGVDVATSSDGTLTLRGKRVDAELRAALIDWLKTREEANQ